jgi:hypothetical protein
MSEPKKTGPKSADEAAAIGACLAKACKTKPSRFGFCEDHFDQFKFGLLKKSGELVPDHEKKLQHYLDYKAKRGAKHVA